MEEDKAPAKPPLLRSYSSAASAPKPLPTPAPTLASVLQPIPPNRFFASPPVPPARPPRAFIKKVPEDYIEIDSDDDEIESSSPAVPLRGKETSKFRPAPMENHIVQARASRMEVSPPYIPISSTRSTQPQRRHQSPEFPPPPPHYVAPVDSAGVLRTDPGGILPPAQSMWGVGWIAPKIVALDNETGRAGIYSASLWDFEVDAPLQSPPEPVPQLSVNGKSTVPYLPLGTWVPSNHSSTVAPISNIESGMASSQDVQMDSADAVDEALVPTPVTGFYTISPQELLAIRPHRYAYFSTSTYSWAIFAPLDNPSSNDPLDIPYNEPEIWKTDRGSRVKPGKISLIRPLPLADPLTFTQENPTETWSYTRCTLLRLRSNHGNEIAYTPDGYFPAVIPAGLWNQLKEVRGSNPAPGREKLEAIYDAAKLIWQSIDNYLFKGTSKGIPLKADGMFIKYMPWDEVTKNIYISILGYTTDDTVLMPPIIDETEAGRLNRTRLLRCWLEVGIWMEVTLSNISKDNKRYTVPFRSRIKIKSSTVEMLKTLGGEPFARVSAATYGWVSKGGGSPAEAEYHGLGIVPDLSDEAIISVYEAQVRLQTDLRPQLLGCIDVIQEVRNSEPLNVFRATERSRGFYSDKELETAFIILGCLSRDVSDDQIVDAYTIATSDTSLTDRKKSFRDALKLIAKDRNSDVMRAILVSEEEVESKMDLAAAYRTLEVSEDIDEDFLNMTFNIRLDDATTSAQKTTMKEAAGLIADARGFSRTRRLIDTGDAGNADEWQTPYISPDRPVGLANIANTCYLNSILQYFFTVRELREAILSFQDSGSAAPVEKRVGGRLVTQKEVERSKRFVVHLQLLFGQLVHASTTSITPETELAYLALVPSKEELETSTMEPTVVEPAAPSSDAILVDPDTTPSNTSAQRSKSPSILGKRGSEHLDDTEVNALQVDDMVIDTQILSDTPLLSGENYGMLSISPVSPSSPASDERLGKRRTTQTFEMMAKEAPDGVIEIGDPPANDVNLPPLPSSPLQVPPPLPPRPASKSLQEEVANHMAFGQQNDVTECADNVLFQLECALSEGSSSQDDAANVIKRTFYGKTRQRLEISDAEDSEPIRTKDEEFPYLLVDVAEEGRDLYDGLDVVFDDAMVTIDGKDARRRVTLVDVPPVLQIQLKRVQYDRVLKKIWKSNAHMSFGDTLTMDRYLEIDPEDTEAVARRDQSINLRQELEKLRLRYKSLSDGKSNNADELLKAAFSHLANQEDLKDVVSSELAEGTIGEANDLRAEITKLGKEITSTRKSLEDIWTGHCSAVYELVSVFIHRGTASSGHYYIYQRNDKKPDSWMKYNDSQVTDVSTEEVFTTSGDTNAYFLVYCRKDRLDAINSVRDVFPQ